MENPTRIVAMMIDQLPMGFILLDEEQRIRYMNRYALVKTGCAWPDAHGKDWSVLFPHTLKEIADGASSSDKTMITTMSGESFVVTLTAFDQPEGRWRLLTLIHANQLDEATKELDSYKNLHADLQAIFDISYDVIYVSDANGVTLRVSSACERLWGYKEEELVGRSVYDLEREGVFSPSITRTGRRMCLLLHPRGSGRGFPGAAAQCFAERRAGPGRYRNDRSGRPFSDLVYGAAASGVAAPF